MPNPNTVPTFTTAGVIGSVATPSLTDSSLTAPTHTATVLTAGSNGTRVGKVRFSLTGTTGGTCYVHLFVYDGTNYRHIDFFPLGSTNAAPFTATKILNEVIPSGSSLVCTNTVGSLGVVTAFAGSF